MSNKKLRGFKFVNDGLIHGEFPSRSTQFSAGYDISSVEELVAIEPGQTVLIKTGLTAYMQPDEVLLLFPRSGLAYKHQITLQNAVGVIDRDYFGNEIGVLLRNEGDKPFLVRRGDRICQAMFTKYLLVDNDFEKRKAERESGFGSTGR